MRDIRENIAEIYYTAVEPDDFAVFFASIRFDTTRDTQDLVFAVFEDSGVEYNLALTPDQAISLVACFTAALRDFASITTMGEQQ